MIFLFPILIKFDFNRKHFKFLRVLFAIKNYPQNKNKIFSTTYHLHTHTHTQIHIVK
jgi:hypothetical protein